MGALIQKQQKIENESITVSVPKPMVDRLKMYATFMESDRGYLVGAAIRLVTDRDKDFQAWLAKQGGAAVEKPARNRRAKATSASS